eukprot:286030_1
MGNQQGGNAAPKNDGITTHTDMAKEKKPEPKQEHKLEQKPQEKQEAGPVDLDKLKEYTLDEIAKHDNKDNGIWIIIKGLVYDVTKFMDQHPGGAFCLLGPAGDDATESYAGASHPPKVMDQANQNFLIGKVKK